MTLIVYCGLNEIFVTTEANEKELLRVYFEEGGRDLDNYDRETFKDEVCIDSRLRAR